MKIKLFTWFTAALFLAGCTSIPDGIVPVKNFVLEDYLGDWYEIARLDHSFERGLTQVSANYTMREDGGVKVINRGFNIDSKKWKDAEGKAYFVNDSDVGHLKVSFFGPFYGSYIIFELDEGYQNALVTSTDKSYLWFLSRKKSLNSDEKQKFLSKVAALGFAVDEIIFVEQSDE